jgi:hypothetical protein
MARFIRLEEGTFALRQICADDGPAKPEAGSVPNAAPDLLGGNLFLFRVLFQFIDFL